MDIWGEIEISIILQRRSFARCCEDLAGRAMEDRFVYELEFGRWMSDVGMTPFSRSRHQWAASGESSM